MIVMIIILKIFDLVCIMFLNYSSCALLQENVSFKGFHVNQFQTQAF